MKRLKQQLGFSMIELMIVLVIIMVISAMATPNIARAVQLIRLRQSTLSVSGLLQRARLEAVRTNRITVVRQDTVDQSIYYMDGQGGAYNADGTRQQGEPMIRVSTGVVPQSSGFPGGLDATLLGYTPTVSSTFNVSFNQRGLPCFPNSTNTSVTACDALGGGNAQTQGSLVNYLYYFQLPSSFGTRWVALTITPAGRIRVWTYNGTTWY